MIGRTVAIAVFVALSVTGAVCGQGVSRQQIQERYQALVAERRAADETIWKQEREAQRYEQTFVALWDKLRAAPDPLAVLEGFAFDEALVGTPGALGLLPEGVRSARLDSVPQRLDRPRWRDLVGRLRAGGVRLVQTEWHHAHFERDGEGRARSTFNIVIHATSADRHHWYDVSGPIEIVWSERAGAGGRPVPASIDATGLTLRQRSGPALFEPQRLGSVTYPANYGTIIARDLDGDGLSEILCPPANVVFRNLGEGRFERQPLCEEAVKVVLEALLADFTGDGRPDLLLAGSNPGPGQSPTRYPLFLYPGDGSVGFGGLPHLAVDPQEVILKYPIGMTAGDIDGDGDLDLFCPQYLQPYVGGQFPTPYYDANDGLPAYLLRNRGDGTFEDVTEVAGLAPKRKRRTFRSSFVDLDEDGDLDLLVVSDFAGVDVYANDGRGRFTDVTSSVVDLATNFGMAHTFGDFDTDGHLDFYVTGMASTTARRLERMGAARQEFPGHQAQRMVTGYGNRMYLRSAAGRYAQPAFRDSVARSGWSWGCVTGDFNNDGHPDLYIANGNKSGESAQDYCTTFWCHDIYSGSSDFDPAHVQLYLHEARGYLTGGISWNGFEHNHLLVNDGGESFVNLGFLMNVALEADCRGVLADDLDGDGRVDLVVDAIAANDKERELVLLLNRRPPGGHHWIGVRVGEKPGVSALGARVTIGYGDGRQSGVIVAGDSFGVQHPPTSHFGLGARQQVDFIEVRWPDGTLERLERPAVDRYHVLEP